VREGDGVVIVYDLDECGAPETGAGNKLVLSNISEISWEEQIDEGDEVTERNFGGQKCYSDTGQDEITYVNVNVTSCGINPALDSFLMGSTLHTDGGDVVGYSRVDLAAGSTNVAIEVLMKLDTDACTGGGTAPVAGWFFPLVKNWRPSGATTLNGSDLVKPQYAGKGYKNEQVFDGSPYDLDRWETIVTEADDWYAFYIFDDITVLPTADCEPTTFATTS
jgi:hypothetical protein